MMSVRNTQQKISRVWRRQVFFKLAALIVAGVSVGSLALSVGKSTAFAAREFADLVIAGPTQAVYPGDVVAISIEAQGLSQSVEGKVFARLVPLWLAAENQWRGVFGVPLDTPAGQYEIAIHAIGEPVANTTGRFSFRVQDKDFATRRLRLDQKFVDPPQAEAQRIAQDAKTMANIFSKVRPARLWDGPFQAPVSNASNSSFGRLTLFNGAPRGRHQGADFRSPAGTSVRAPNAGEVVLASDLYFAGSTVILDHGLGLYSLFAHLSKFQVSVGDHVATGEVVARSGATGRVTGAHLHWAVRLGNTSVDPLSLIKASAEVAASSLR